MCPIEVYEWSYKTGCRVVLIMPRKLTPLLSKAEVNSAMRPE